MEHRGPTSCRRRAPPWPIHHPGAPTPLPASRPAAPGAPRSSRPCSATEPMVEPDTVDGETLAAAYAAQMKATWSGGGPRSWRACPGRSPARFYRLDAVRRGGFAGAIAVLTAIEVDPVSATPTTASALPDRARPAEKDAVPWLQKAIGAARYEPHHYRHEHRRRAEAGRIDAGIADWRHTGHRAPLPAGRASSCGSSAPRAEPRPRERSENESPEEDLRPAAASARPPAGEVAGPWGRWCLDLHRTLAATDPRDLHHHLATHRFVAVHSSTTSSSAPTTRPCTATRGGRRLPARGAIRSARSPSDRSTRALPLINWSTSSLRFEDISVCPLVHQTAQVGFQLDQEQMLWPRCALGTAARHSRRPTPPRPGTRYVPS